MIIASSSEWLATNHDSDFIIKTQTPSGQRRRLLANDTASPADCTARTYCDAHCQVSVDAKSSGTILLWSCTSRATCRSTNAPYPPRLLSRSAGCWSGLAMNFYSFLRGLGMAYIPIFMAVTRTHTRSFFHAFIIVRGDGFTLSLDGD